MKKVILIGIDGATPYLIEKWIRDGKLPNFQKIQGSGVWGRLKSTIPPFSAPAWTSIVTGCNPGKHGIYGFESTGTLEQHIISSRHRKVPAVWNFLTDIGLKNIVVNVPGSYPPEEINGIMITGLLTPSLESNFTYPSYIKQRLKKDDLGNYELEQLWLEDYSRSRIKKHAPQKLLDTINRQLESRAQVALNLMKESDWNFTMVVFRGTDTAQHFLFENKNLLLLCYQKVDEIIGTIMEKIPDALFFIVSDHGFEEIDKEGLIWYVGDFENAYDSDDIPVPNTDHIAIWNGYQWMPAPIMVNRDVAVGLTRMRAVVSSGEDIYFGGEGLTAVTLVSASETFNNLSTAESYPVMRFTRAIGTEANIIYILNEETGKKMNLIYEMSDGEEVIIDFRPGQRTISSGEIEGDYRRYNLDAPHYKIPIPRYIRLDKQRNKIKTIIPGSDFATWSLIPGENTISVFVQVIGDAIVTCFMRWQPIHWSIDAAVA